MPAHVTVYPTKASALNVKHPHGPKMSIDGVLWPKDSFTGRRLRDGSVTMNEAKGLKAIETAASKAAATVLAPAPSSEPETAPAA